jgi:hypothetical protein
MKRPHRRIHLIIWLVLTPIVILGFLAILRMRPPEPYSDLDAILDNRSD